MKRATCVLAVVGCLTAAMWGQVPAPTQAAQPVPVAVAPQVQAQVDAAWKDLQIAQLKLQLVVEQAVEQMDKGTYYDYGQQKFMRRPEPAKVAEKPAIPAKK